VVSETNEQELESLIGKALMGQCLEKLKADGVRETNHDYDSSKHVKMGFAADFGENPCLWAQLSDACLWQPPPKPNNWTNCAKLSTGNANLLSALVSEDSN